MSQARGSKASKSRASVTLLDVARTAGVSRATVGNVLSGESASRGKHAPETQARVLSVAEQLGYVPSLAARRLRTQRSQLIGLFLAVNLDDRYYATTVRTVESSLGKEGYRLTLAMSSGGSDNGETRKRFELHQLDAMRGDNVDGLIVGPVHDKSELGDHRAFTDLKIPSVFFGADCGSPLDEAVYDVDGAYRIAARHFQDKGHEHIGYLCAPRNPLAKSGPKPALIRALRAVGYTDTEWLITYKFPITLEGSYHSALEFINRWKSVPAGKRPTGMICLTDSVALTAMAAARDCGVDVPNDLSFIGCSNYPESSYLNPSLTTISFDLEVTVRNAVELLLSRLSKPNRPRDIRVTKPYLIERASVLAKK